MSDHTAKLIQEVIEAAREGRYCHGNGSIYCIVDRMGDKKNGWMGSSNWVIDLNGPSNFDFTVKSSIGFTAQGSKTMVSERNPVAPHKDLRVAAQLEEFLSLHQGSVCSHEVSVDWQIRGCLKEAIKAGTEERCLHFNGGQLYFKVGGRVVVYDFSIMGVVPVYTMGWLASRNYMNSVVSDEAKRASEYFANEAEKHYAQYGMYAI
jgi:hypothetical protein